MLAAYLNNNTVVKVIEIDEATYANDAKSYQLIIDVSDASPTPLIGWVLDGNRIVPPTDIALSDDDKDALQQSDQRKYGIKLVSKYVDKIGARNLKLYREGTPVDVVTISTQLGNVRALLEGGALKTARALCSAIQPILPNYNDILSEAISDITSFLAANGWDS